MGGDGVAEGFEGGSGGGKELSATGLQGLHLAGDGGWGIWQMEAGGDGQGRGEEILDEALTFDEEQVLAAAFADEAGVFEVWVAGTANDHGGGGTKNAPDGGRVFGVGAAGGNGDQC